jgi:hypothetical protein
MYYPQNRSYTRYVHLQTHRSYTLRLAVDMQILQTRIGPYSLRASSADTVAPWRTDG